MVGKYDQVFVNKAEGEHDCGYGQCREKGSWFFYIKKPFWVRGDDGVFHMLRSEGGRVIWTKTKGFRCDKHIQYYTKQLNMSCSRCDFKTNSQRTMDWHMNKAHGVKTEFPG